MTRVPWSRIDSGDFEEILGTFLGNRLPNAQRVRPSQGDGGIDIFVPLDGSRLDVFQAKRYVDGGLTPKRKAEILQSVAVVTERFGDRIREWHLVLPMNPTPQMLAWFESEVTTQHDFACYWNGETWLDGLAAEHPHVVNYYFGNGREILEGRLANMTTVMNLQDVVRTGQQIAAPDVVVQLSELVAAVNVEDPHFEYHVATAPAGEAIPVGSTALYSQSQEINGVTVGIAIHQKFETALTFRPIPMTVTFNAPLGSAKLNEINDFLDYGTPLVLGADEITSIVTDLPERARL